ncbi:hypothetical protein DESA109040_17700 [Deinococcus saxicola]
MVARSCASGPVWSQVHDNGSTPCVLQSGCPFVGLYPATPHHAAGTRMLPPVSVPSAKSTCLSATLTAAPLLLPPGMRAGFCGWVVLP